MLNSASEDLVISSTHSEKSAGPNGSPCWMQDWNLITLLLKYRFEGS